MRTVIGNRSVSLVVLDASANIPTSPMPTGCAAGLKPARTPIPAAARDYRRQKDASGENATE